MDIIESLTVIMGNGFMRTYCTKENDWRLGILVSKIINDGSEFNGSVHSEYLMEDENGNLIAHIENCPVIVEYERSDLDELKRKARR